MFTKLTLNGKWALSCRDRKLKVPAIVPGDVHKALLSAKKIPDPYYRDNELKLMWIGESAWTWSRSFKTSRSLLNKKHISLRCLGLDTLASIKLNGRILAETDNMFRSWEWDIRKYLKPGQNTISIRFDSAMKYCRNRAKKKKLPSWVPYDRYWIRKEQCNFGWDWGPSVATCGIWRDIDIMAWNDVRLSDIQIRQKHSTAHKVSLAVSIQTAGKSTGLKIRTIVSRLGRQVTSCLTALKEGLVKLDIPIPKAQLWWPAGMGSQPLYDVLVELLDEKDRIIDTTGRRIGLRKLELVRKKDKWGQSFYFKVNGRSFFSKGANWIPGDAILANMQEKDYRRLLKASVDVNMNMLRVWGGGIYESDIFYDICDELGILVWQDFMFACAAYPSFDSDFIKSVKVECADNILRLRHHPSIALWCGNNEIEMGLTGTFWTGWTMSWKAYSKLFDKLIRTEVKKYDPDREYWPGSPHTPIGKRRDANNADSGDAHLWTVWHGREPFEWYYTSGHRFVSEFGFQSFPEPRTVRTYTLPEDRNVTSRIMEHHQRSKIGNTAIMQYMLDWFRLPSSFEMTLWTSQILQGIAMKIAVEHWRRNMPRSMGALYWQLNDCWQVASWASIDYLGRWKALHYMARHFFSPVLVSGVVDDIQNAVEIHLTSDLDKSLPAQLSWLITDLNGKKLAGNSSTLKTPVNGSRRHKTLKLDKVLGKNKAEEIIVWLELKTKEQPVSRNMVLPARPKHLELSRDPGFKYSLIKTTDKSFELTISSARIALWTWLEIGIDVNLSNNFFHLRPGLSEKILISSERKISADRLKESLKLHSLTDTYI